MTLYHGSDHIVSKPFYGGGGVHNDYGQGFYCTEHLELAREWSCLRDRQAFVNQYDFNPDGLKVLNLSKPPFHILNWLAILLENRVFDLRNTVALTGRDYLLHEFLPDYMYFDVIRGYRADDSYFAFANDFLNNSITLSHMARAMHLGYLGEQVMIKSQKAFDRINYLSSEPVDTATYGSLRKKRDMEARAEYHSIAAEGFSPEGTYLIDIIRDKWKNDDTRLR